MARRHPPRFAVSDGASISYDSAGWARAVCRAYVRGGEPGPRWIAAARAAFRAASRVDPSDWVATAAAARGSFATFLGFAFEGERLLVHAIGDTVLFILYPDDGLVMVPAMAPSDFAAPPALLCSVPGRSAFDDSPDAFAGRLVCFPPPPGGWEGSRLVAVTDALAAWVAEPPDDAGRRARLHELLGLSDRDAFARWVRAAVADGRLKYDDCLVLAVLL